jgi:predicted GIY-YIG superfamily endonuclease
MNTTLYRHFAKDGALLYVGISLSWPKRTKSHARGSRWFTQITSVTMEHFPTREAALDAERAAIIAEKPKHNVVHNRGNTAASDRNRDWTWLDGMEGDRLLSKITGPDAIVGPALVYHDDNVSIMIAHGDFGSEGVLTEAVLGELAPELPPFSEVVSTVISIIGSSGITMADAQKSRGEVIEKLRRHLRNVEVCDNDLDMATAYATRFPSEKSRQVLAQVSSEGASA